VVRISWRAAADETGLFSDEFEVIFVAKAARLGMSQPALVDGGSRGRFRGLCCPPFV